MSENKKEKVKEPKAPLTKKQKITVIIVSVVAALAVCAGIIALIATLGNGSYTIEGTYALVVEADYQLSSEYTFTENQATRVYDFGDGPITETFSYEIKDGKDGRIITFTNVETGEVDGPLSYAEETDKNGAVKAVFINGVRYEKQ